MRFNWDNVVLIQFITQYNIIFYLDADHLRYDGIFKPRIVNVFFCLILYNKGQLITAFYNKNNNLQFYKVFSKTTKQNTAYKILYNNNYFLAISWLQQVLTILVFRALLPQLVIFVVKLF